MELLRELHRGGATICMVTHDPGMRVMPGDRFIFLTDASWKRNGSRHDFAAEIEKAFQHGPSRTYVLRRITLDIKQGEFVSIMGPSGAGNRRCCT